MPSKDGTMDDNKKSTKDVVNKKQKQMMNQEEYLPEEEYDHYKDRMAMAGREIRSKDTKDASSYPQSRKKVKGDTPMQKEFKKKYGKKATALDAVKADITKKYGKGAIMNVGKKKANEELDLTKIAEAFGGCIIEATPQLGPKSKEYLEKLKKEKPRSGRISKRQVKIGAQGKILPGEGEASKETELIQNLTKNLEQGELPDPMSDKMREIERDPMSDEIRKRIESDKDRFVDKTREFTQRDTKVTKGNEPKRIRTIPFKRKPTYSPEVEKQIDRIKKEISQRDTKKKKDKDIRDIINPDKRKKPAYVSTSSPGFGEPETINPSTPLTFTNRPKGVRDTGTGLSRSFKDFGKEIDSYGDRLKAFRKDFDKIKPQKDRVIVDQDPSNEIKKTGRKPKKEVEPQTDTDGVGTVPPGRANITTSDDRGKGKNSIVSLTRKALKNPALTFLTFDTLRKYLPSASPFGIRGGRVGTRSAPS